MWLEDRERGIIKPSLLHMMLVRSQPLSGF